ncbi:MAG: DUF3336 domain-containing protein [Myxococcota bacterium]
MTTANTYEEWKAVAAEAASRRNADAWRGKAESSIFDAELLTGHTAELAALRESGEARELVGALQDALYRHLGELADPHLYEVTPLGTKHVVRDFYDEALACIAHLSDHERTGLSFEFTLAGFRRARHIFGRSGLMLSGGATLGFFHLGVVKALFEHQLLPRVLSGASMGAIVACGVGVRTDDELRALFEDRTEIRTDAIKPLPPAKVTPGRAIYDSKRLEEVVAHNCGDYTFAEAEQRTGRTVNVSVSPTRERQKPRVLCHYTTPNVLMNSAAVASAAIPGVFKPATLRRRNESGEVSAYAPTERWVDGTVKGDLPMRRLSRLHNVNHFIVSQVNPHVAPVMSVQGKRGVVPWAAGLTVKGVRGQIVHGLELARTVARDTPFYKPLDQAHSLTAQRYSGDIDIYPRFRAGAFLRAFSNITHAELERHILEGERATWPLLARIRDQTCVSRALDAAVQSLKRQRRRAAESQP